MNKPNLMIPMTKRTVTCHDINVAIPNGTFPHTTEKGRIKGTIANLDHLFFSYGITCQYDEILKKQTVSIASENINESDLSETSNVAQIRSLLSLNDMPLNTLDLLPALLANNVVNPILEWITSKHWDGKDRLTAFYDSLSVNTVDIEYRNLAVKTWLIQCVAAADNARHTPIKNAIPKFELVLVLQGNQGAGKTTWFKSLVPTDLSQYVIEGLHLDTENKDSIKRAISAWICELGELGSTFRKSDIDRIKAFLSLTVDDIRLPYDRVSNLYRRRTVFGGSVNENEFLTDSTGARRFLPIAINVCLSSNTDLQQLWAQVWGLYISGEQWWCNADLEEMLISRHEQHTVTNAVEDLVPHYWNVHQTNRTANSLHKSTTQILQVCGIQNPTKEQLRQCKTYLEKRGFIRVQSLDGRRGYWLESAGIEISEPPRFDTDYNDGKTPQQRYKEKQSGNFISEFSDNHKLTPEEFKHLNTFAMYRIKEEKPFTTEELATRLYLFQQSNAVECDDKPY
jgi:putative DNA primase/helicase